MKSLLMNIYGRLYRVYGPQHWWPGECALEVMVGAILTQNTSWKNVEKAIQRLKERSVLSVKGLQQLKRPELASLVKSSGYYRIKAERLKTFVEFLSENYDGNIERMKREKLQTLRPKLLGLKGIGPETADSILLYGLGKPIFVIDAYTKRILCRHHIISEKASYGEIQRLLLNHLPHHKRLFNEYHALLVHLGKSLCRKVPRCEICPIRGIGQRERYVAIWKHQIPRTKLQINFNHSNSNGI